MPLLIATGIVIGCACTTLLYVLARQKRTEPKVTIRADQGFVTLDEYDRIGREGYARKQSAWIAEHTDPFFGSPVAEGYNAPFPHNKAGYVFVEITDEFPKLDQHYIFEWMVERIGEIITEAGKVLQKSLPEWSNQDEAAGAFRAERISRILMEGAEPVRWMIFFDTDIGEGESLRAKISGKDQCLESAELSM